MSTNLGLLRESMYQSLRLLAELECHGPRSACVGCDSGTDELHHSVCWVGRAIDATDSAVMMLDEPVTAAAIAGVQYRGPSI